MKYKQITFFIENKILREFIYGIFSLELVVSLNEL